MISTIDKTGLPRAWIGIDPGADGGAIALTDSGSVIRCPFAGTTPIERWKWLRGVTGLYRTKALLEQLQPAIFGTGKSSCAKMFGSYTELRAFLVALSNLEKLEWSETPAQSGKSGWIRKAGIEPRRKGETVSKWKERHRRQAIQLYNDNRISKPLCDAYLLAWLCCEESRKVCEPTKVNGLVVSTVCTPDCGYETAIVDKKGAHPVGRYETKEEASLDHQTWVDRITAGLRNVTKLGWGDLIADEEITLEPS